MHFGLIKNLSFFYHGDFLLKLKSIVLIAFPIGTFSWLLSQFNEWTECNQNYIAVVLICITIDHIVGTIYHAFKLKDFCFKKNAVGTLKKLSLCVLSAILFEVIHSTLQNIPFLYDYLKSVTRLVVVLYPAGSAFINMSALTNGSFPPLGWIKKIKAFNEDLDIKKFDNG